MDINTTIIALIYLTGIALILIVNEIFYRQLKIKGEISRKFAHFITTLSTIPLPYVVTSHWYVLILAFIFFLVLFISQNSSQFRSIHDIERKSMGSYLLPLSIYATFVIAQLIGNKLMFVLPMLILAISDPAAAIVGISMEKYNHRIKIFGYDTQKSMFGSGAFFISSLIISLIALYLNRGSFNLTTIGFSLIIAFVGTIGEMFSWRGSDNLSVPLSVILILTIIN